MTFGFLLFVLSIALAIGSTALADRYVDGIELADIRKSRKLILVILLDCYCYETSVLLINHLAYFATGVPVQLQEKLEIIIVVCQNLNFELYCLFPQQQHIKFRTTITIGVSN